MCVGDDIAVLPHDNAAAKPLPAVALGLEIGGDRHNGRLDFFDDLLGRETPVGKLLIRHILWLVVERDTRQVGCRNPHRLLVIRKLCRIGRSRGKGGIDANPRKDEHRSGKHCPEQDAEHHQPLTFFARLDRCGLCLLIFGVVPLVRLFLFFRACAGPGPRVAPSLTRLLGEGRLITLTLLLGRRLPDVWVAVWRLVGLAGLTVSAAGGFRRILHLVGVIIHIIAHIFHPFWSSSVCSDSLDLFDYSISDNCEIKINGI